MPSEYIDIPLTAKQKQAPPPAFEDVPLPSSPKTWAQRMGLGGALAVPIDAAEGVTAGLASSVFHGGDLIRRGLGMERVIDTPEAQQAMTAPDNLAGKAGYFLEQGAEFAVPLTRVSKAVKGAGLLKRALAEGAASTGVAGVQSGGDPIGMVAGGVGGAVLPFAGAGARAIGRGVQRAAQGAKDGGLGGAIAAGVRTVAPGAPRTMLIQALKPRNSRVHFPSALDRAIPEIKAAESVLGKPIETIDELLTATKAAKRGIQGQLNQVRGTAQGLEIDGSAVADAMARSVPKKLVLENPDAAKRLVDAADVYRRPFSLDEMETLLIETNAELDSFYSMFPQAKGKALASNPATAALDAQAKAFRTAIDTGLDRMADGGGAAAKELRRRYGSLLEVEGEAVRRANVAARQQPESLSEQIGAVRAAGEIARGSWKALHGDITGLADIAAGTAGRSTAKAIKDQQTTDALIRRAFAGYKGKATPVVMPTPRLVRGLLPRGPLVTPEAPDPSFVRSVPAMPAQSTRLALPAGRPSIVTPQGADPSFVRGVPADVARRDVRGALPPASRPMPAVQSSGGGGVRAKSIVVRDPRTGRMRRIYLSGEQ